VTKNYEEDDMAETCKGRIENFEHAEESKKVV
jgi:hypothetical protein